jgi:hypothetical protein
MSGRKRGEKRSTSGSGKRPAPGGSNIIAAIQSIDQAVNRFLQQNAPGDVGASANDLSRLFPAFNLRSDPRRCGEIIRQYAGLLDLAYEVGPDAWDRLAPATGYVCDYLSRLQPAMPLNPSLRRRFETAFHAAVRSSDSMANDRQLEQIAKLIASMPNDT